MPRAIPGPVPIDQPRPFECPHDGNAGQRVVACVRCWTNQCCCWQPCFTSLVSVPPVPLRSGVPYAFVSYIGRSRSADSNHAPVWSMQQAVVAAERVDALLQQPQAAAAKGQALIGAGTIRLAGAIRLCSPIVQFCTMRPWSSLVAFYGLVRPHQGSGKSTLLSLLLRFYESSKGRHDRRCGDWASSVLTISVQRLDICAAGSVLAGRQCAREHFHGRDLSQDAIETAAKKRPTATISSRNWKTATNVSW